MADEKAAWTVLAYMAGDNNLTEEMVWSLSELKKASARLEARQNLEGKNRINVVAHFDPRGSRSRRYDFVPSFRMLAAEHAGQPENAPQEAAEAAGDGNLSSYEAVIYTRRGVPPPPDRKESKPLVEPAHARVPSNPLAAFVHEQLHRAPGAKQYFLILSGHGSGAVGDFLIDSDPTTSLSIPTLATILKVACKRKRLAILGMDSCLMSNAEVCCEVSPYADYLVASEGWVANAGWPYHRVLEACVEDEKALAEPLSVAERVAKNYSDFYRDYEISGMSTDIAVCTLDAFHSSRPNSLVGRVRALARFLAEAFDAAFVSEALSRTEIRDKQAKGLLGGLSEEIDRLLGQGGSLAKELMDGSARARKALRKSLKTGLTDRQWKSLCELQRLSGKDDDSTDRDLETRIKPAVLQLFNRPPSPSWVLALVRVSREFDPAIIRALRLIENPNRNGTPEAKQARVTLQKLHQVQSVLELRDLARRANRRNARAAKVLLNAVVSARWQAQSFKGGVYVDLYDFCRCLHDRLPDRHPVRALCRDVQDAVKSSISISSPKLTGPDSQHAHGLSVYFPYQSTDYTTEYDNLEFTRRTGWGRLVRSYLRATRRERQNERERWLKPHDNVLRFGRSEVDPLESDGIEACIVGVLSLPSAGKDGTRLAGRAGTEAKIRAGTEAKIRAGTEAKIRAGTEAKIRAGTEAKIKAAMEGKIREGTEAKIRAGTEAKIRGEGVQFVWGNPPDGFFRQDAAD